MRFKGLAGTALAALGLFSTTFAAAQGVRFSEIHYDNTGTDAGEAIEVAGPAGTDLTGWSVVLYNGSSGAAYDTKVLSGTIPATCGARGVVVVNYAANGIQNGAPDAMALVDAGNDVIEFLSYEGSFAAVDGPAAGLTSTDILVQENGTGALGESLARRADGAWNTSAPNSFGACNDDGAPPAAVVSVTVAPGSASLAIGGTATLAASGLDANGQVVNGATFAWSSSTPAVATVSSGGVVSGVSGGDAVITATAASGATGTATVHVNGGQPSSSPVRINEIHYDNAGTDANEAIEVEGPAGTDLTGYTLVLYNGNGGVPYGITQTLSGALPASCGDRGVAFVGYPADGIQNGPDGIALVDETGALVEFISYEGVVAATTGPAAGRTSVDIGVAQSNAPVGLSLQRTSTGTWQANTASFGACNTDLPAANKVFITGRTPGDAPLPVGFQDQLFARLADVNNQTIPSSFTWVAETPAIATIEPNGLITALGEGSATFRATAADGTTSTITLPTRIAVASTTAQYAGNAEFGEPTDADPSDDYLVRYPQYTASYNPNRGTPNWVAYDLDATHFGAEDRCDCFTMDPALPASFTQLTTDDYTDAAVYHGYGIDRGHMTRSFDRTAGSLDNAYTYLFDNVVPQASDLNQGPWAMFENYLGDLARFDDREVYIITGVAGNKGTLKGLGRVVIPASTWKVAVILPRDQGLSYIHDYRDLEVIAVDMPNEPGVRNVDWHSYLTTVDAIETLTGYDLLALLPDDVEAAVESNTRPPIAAVSGPGSLAEGGGATFDASASLDPNGSVVAYQWDFGDGTSAAGATAAHVFAQDGVYLVTVTVTDNDGLTDTATLAVSVANVAPTIGAIPNASLDAGKAYTVSGSFSDPGADAWTATVDWGDGSAPGQAMLGGHDFSLVHVYPAAGTFAVTVTIADDDASVSTTHTLTVTTPAARLAPALALIDQLVGGGLLPRAAGVALKAEVLAVQTLLDRGKPAAASVMLKAMVVEIDLLVRLRQATAADLAPLRGLLVDVLGAL